MEEARKADFNSSDDEELLRAAEALEKVVTVSDEEWVEAAIALESIELGGEDEDDSQGCQIKGIRQARPSMSKEEAYNIPNQKLSSGMLSRHPDRNQEKRKGMMAKQDVSMDRVEPKYKGLPTIMAKKKRFL